MNAGDGRFVRFDLTSAAQGASNRRCPHPFGTPRRIAHAAAYRARRGVSRAQRGSRVDETSSVLFAGHDQRAVILEGKFYNGNFFLVIPNLLLDSRSSLLVLACCCSFVVRTDPHLRPGPSESDVFLMGLPLIGGLIDSVIGILTGTVYGIAPQLPALLRSLGIPV
jgi:hypothetical protein